MEKQWQDLVVEINWDSIMAIFSHFSVQLGEQYRKCLKNEKKNLLPVLARNFWQELPRGKKKASSALKKEEVPLEIGDDLFSE